MLHFLFQNDQRMLQQKGESLKLSFAQGIVYAVRNGPINRPKSILLPTLIKSFSNNTVIISVVNKLSHGVNYTVLMETHTENAYKHWNSNLKISSSCRWIARRKNTPFTVLIILIARRKPCQVIKYPFSFLHSISCI